MSRVTRKQNRAPVRFARGGSHNRHTIFLFSLGGRATLLGGRTAMGDAGGLPAVFTERGRQLVFDSEAHTYSVNGTPVPASVTGLLDTLWHTDTQALAARCGPGARRRATGDEWATDEQVMAAWAKNRDAAAARGNAIHASLHAAVCGLAQCPPDAPPPPPGADEADGLWTQWLWDTVNGGDRAATLVLPEMPLWGTVLDGPGDGDDGTVVAGTPDLLVRRPGPRAGRGGAEAEADADADADAEVEAEWSIYDWKSVEPDRILDPYKGVVEAATGECVRGTKQVLYSVQLALYCAILRRHYGIDIPPERRFIVSVVPGETPQVVALAPDSDALAQIVAA